MVSLFLIILYTVVLVIFFVRISRSYRNYLSGPQVALSFVFKIAFGYLYGFLFLKFYNGDDTWQYHNDSLVEYKNLLQSPLHFFTNLQIKSSGSSSLNSIYDTTNSLWNKLDDELFVKLLTFFDLFSFGSYYVNAVLYCAMVYMGHSLLFRLFSKAYPSSRSLLIIAIFFNPMIIFWLSGIRKEGLLMLGIAVVLYFFDKIISGPQKLVFNLTIVLAGLLTLLICRNAVVMCLAPSLVAWFICSKLKWNPPLTFLVVYFLSVTAFFVSGAVPGFPDLAEKVAQRQHDFLKLTANTRLPLDRLTGTASSYLAILPQAFNHSFLRPYLAESKGMLQILSSLDVIAFLLVAVAAMVFYNTNWKRILSNPLILTCLLTSIFGYLLIGYTVPFPGAFIRYKAIFELLFLCCFASLIDLKKIRLPAIIKNLHIVFFI